MPAITQLLESQPYEGAEKIVELTIDSSELNLLELDKSFWQRLVSRANAEIISYTSNEQCVAYLLSESSLFVWHDRFRIITCGTTTLWRALLYAVEKLGKEAIASVIYQRKNECYPAAQLSTFEQDCLNISEHIKGDCYLLGDIDTHHHQVFIKGKGRKGKTSRVTQTSQLQMSHLNHLVADFFLNETVDAKAIFTKLNLRQLLPEFSFSDHLYSPTGYSVNGLFQDNYISVHISPDKTHFYISVETNLPAEQVTLLFNALISLLSPYRWDCVTPEPLIGLKPVTVCCTTSELLISKQEMLHFNYFQQLAERTILPKVL